MATEVADIPIAVPLAAAAAAHMQLRGTTHGRRDTVLPRLQHALRHCGCFVLEERDTSIAQTELLFEMPLRAAFDLYGALLATGLELDRATHTHLGSLCTVRSHPLPRRGRIVRIELCLTFLDEDEPDDMWFAIGLA